ncbi:MAG: carotenoid 1,2-hydratase [Casimicrobiaceae bacterium]
MRASGVVMRSRRVFLLGGLALAALPRAVRAAAAPTVGAAAAYPAVAPRALRFPEDFGAHPRFRTEWWYMTGWLEYPGGAPVGMQVTFFRSRPGVNEDEAKANTSRFAPTQLVFAHAALADPAHGRLQHDERAARAGFGLAEARVGNTDVVIDGWSLRRDGTQYRIDVAASGFALDLVARVTQPPLLEGDAGVSRKGPRPGQASYYYSEPHLAIDGRVIVAGVARAVTGRAWLDHEWSSEYLPAGAAGWDWTGINLHDGGALMAFVMRREDGGALWAGGSVRDAAGNTRVLGPADVRFVPRRTWTSPRTGARYPVAVSVVAAGVTYALDPLFDDQELDARRSTGIIYWEGAVRARRDGAEVGRGYLELTGYAGTLKLVMGSV